MKKLGAFVAVPRYREYGLLSGCVSLVSPPHKSAWMSPVSLPVKGEFPYERCGMFFLSIFWDQNEARSLHYGLAVLAFLQIDRSTEAGDTFCTRHPSDIIPRDANSLDKLQFD